MAWSSPKTWTTGAVVTKTDLDTEVRDNLNFLKKNISLEAATELTIASGIVVKTQSNHTIDTESDAASDNLNCINGGTEGDVISIRPVHTDRTIVVKHQSGVESNNIWNPSGTDISLDDANDVLKLQLTDSKWCVIGGGAPATALGTLGTKNPVIDADLVISRDSASSWALVTSTWTQIKAFLKTYFDTLYNLYVHPNHTGDVTSVADGATTIVGKNDDSAMTFGTGGTASLLYETADANANCLVLALPDGGATDVPVLVIGDQSVINKDLTYFNGITAPTIAILSADELAWLRINNTGIYSSGNLIIQPNADLDDYLTIATVSNIPTLYGTGAYLRIGDAAVTSESLASEDDLMVSGKLEVDGIFYPNSGVVFGGDYILTGSQVGFAYRVTDGQFDIEGRQDMAFVIDNDNTYTPLYFYWFDGAHARNGTKLMQLSDGGELQIKATVAAFDVDSNTLLIKARDTGIALVEVGKVVGAADPYFQIGRDDTGVALNAVTDMLVLLAGGGTGNIAANFGLGISFLLASDLSVNAERASIDCVVTNPTLATYASQFNFNAMNAGSLLTRLSVGSLGIGFFATTPVAQQTGIAAQKINYAAGDLDTEAEIISALNTTNTAINALRTALNNYGLTSVI